MARVFPGHVQFFLNLWSVIRYSLLSFTSTIGKRIVGWVKAKRVIKITLIKNCHFMSIKQENHKALIIDDDAEICRLLKYFLKRQEFETAVFDSAEKALQEKLPFSPQVILLDWHIEAGVGGLDALRQFSAQMPTVPVIMLTVENSTEVAVAAMKAGAFDFFVKPIDQDRLSVCLKSALALYEERRQRSELEMTLGQVARNTSFPEIIACSPAMKSVFHLMERVLDRDLTVLIQGESGTGKEVVAQALHYRGKRRNGNFVAVNCAALPESLAESQLFGHEKGAFTGASSSQPGHIERADKGTLFLDEVGDMPLVIQPKFLRCLQDKKVQRIGGSQVRTVDMRLIAATNRDLMGDVRASRFREDLFYRLAVFPIRLPPLRERPEDIALLVRHFLQQTGREKVWIDPEAMHLLESYHWPGNIRELQNAISRLGVLMDGDRLLYQNVVEQFNFHATGPIEIQTQPAHAPPHSTPSQPFPQPTTNLPHVHLESGLPTPGPQVPSFAPPPASASPTPPPATVSTPPSPVTTSFPVPPYQYPQGTPYPPNPSMGFPHQSPPVKPAEEQKVTTLAEAERQAIERALAFCQGNVSEAARILDIGRATLYRYIRRHNLRVD